MKNTCIILFLIITHVAYGQNNAQKIDSFLTAFSNETTFNGNVLIAEKGNVIYQRSFGYANIDTKEFLNENSVFELASVSKQFTAMAIVMLKESGKLSYDDDITKYIHELSFYKNITIRNLLNHTGGLPDYMELMDTVFDKRKIATNNDIITTFAKYQPQILFAPNTQWEYSNTGYALLATIIERVSGMSYGDYLAQHIFKPLGMSNTLVHRRRYAPEKINNYAYGYFYSDSLKKYVLPDNLPETNMVVWLDGVVGDGCVNSTVTDLLKWDRALYTDKLITPESKKEIFTSSLLADSSKTEYGFGWFIEDNGLYGQVVSHTGGWPGYITIIDRHIENDKTIIVLLNYDDAKTTYIPITDLRKLLYNIELLKFIELQNEEIEKFAGDYENKQTGRIRKVMAENGKLYLMDNDNALELKPISKTKFYLTQYQPEIFYEFILQDGKVEKYIMTQPETKVERQLIKIN